MLGEPLHPLLRVSGINKKGLTWENLLFDLCPHVSGSGLHLDEGAEGCVSVGGASAEGLIKY